MPCADNDCGKSSEPFNDCAGKQLPTYPDSIVNNDQNSFQNNGTGISTIPYLDLAFLANTKCYYNPDVVIALNTISLKWCDFLNLFFKSPGEGFFINPANSTSKAILFSNQFYESTQSKCIPFNLNDQLVKCWSKTYGKNPITIPTQMQILLSRFSFLCKSAASIKTYQVALSLDEAISSLLSSGEILPGDCEDSALVKFGITTHILCPFLNVSIAVQFSYCTHIPFYKNANANRSSAYCNYYSGDTTDSRSNFLNTPLGINPKNVYDCKETASVSFSKNESDADSTIFDEVTKILKDEENDIISDGAW